MARDKLADFRDLTIGVQPPAGAEGGVETRILEFGHAVAETGFERLEDSFRVQVDILFQAVLPKFLRWSISFWRRMMPSMSASGRGGQPGTYTSMGIT